MPTVDDPEFDFVPVPPAQAGAIRLELDRAERILWLGRPRPGRMARAQSGKAAVGLFILVPFVAMAFFWEAGAPAVTVFYLAVLNLVGLILLFAPVRAWRRAGMTAYVLTDRRAITFEPIPRWKRPAFRIENFDPDEMLGAYRTEGPDGSGDLIFFKSLAIGQNGQRHKFVRGFLGVDDVREVDRLVRASLKHP